MKLEAIVKKYEKLAEKNNKEAESIKWLIMELSFYSPSQFYLHLKDEMTESFEKMIDEAANKYIFEHIPVQHILGFSYFFGYKFKVNHDVLIPRRETEELVEEVLFIYDQYFEDKDVKALDLGTGSGCIAITLNLEEDHMHLTATDISDLALSVAKENNQELGAKVDFIKSNWFDEVKGKFDIIVANPPYIPSNEQVDEIVKQEPGVALYGGDTGVEPYEIILKHANQFLNEKGLIAFEHGYQQSADIKALVETYLPDAKVMQKKDMQGKDRMTLIGMGGVLS